MVEFDTIIHQFGEFGDKTGWTYIEIAADLAEQIKPGTRRAFRVKGLLDNFEITGKSLLPFGEGSFILPFNQEMRKGTRKNCGAMLHVKLEEDKDFKVEIPPELEECFEFEPNAAEYFYSLTKSHQGYFIKWINDAKTPETRARRIERTVNATLRKMDYGMMLREIKKERED